MKQREIPAHRDPEQRIYNRDTSHRLTSLTIDLGVLFELVLCYLFFYTPFAESYDFAPVPWHVYLFAFHGTVMLIGFEEVKKYYRRKGYPLEFLG